MFSSHQVWSNFYNPQNWVEEIIENTKTVQLAGDVIPMSGKGSRHKDLKIIKDQLHHGL